MLTLEEVTFLAAKGELLGEYDNIPEEVYHEGPGVSRSDLSKLLKSPEHLDHYKATVFKDTPAFVIGTALHCYVLEPKKFNKNYVCMPEGMTRKQKAYGILLNELEEHQKLLSFNDMEKVIAMGEKFKAHPVCAEFLKGAKFEVTYYWLDPKTKTLLKARLDIVHPTLGVMDLKSTSGDARRTEFSRACLKYNYDLQAAHYWYGAAVAQKKDYPFYFGVIESSEPHGVVVHKADLGFIECGLEIQEFLLDKLDAYTKGTIPYSYPEEVVSLALPPWGYDLDSRLERRE